MVALISTYFGYIALSFLPPLAWLTFYLHEDRHPEPKHLLLLTFIAGVISALVAVVIEVSLFSRPIAAADGTVIFPGGLFYFLTPGLLVIPSLLFSGVALVEEFVKYLAVRVTALKRPEFNEPVDAMIYMVAAALGFAAIENVFFLTRALEQSVTDGIGLTINRFLGANLLHALSSAIVGYFIARHYFSPWRKHAIFVGVLLASALHGLFNYFIIIRDTFPAALILIIVLLVFMAVDVFVDFERLKKRESETPTAT